MKLNNKRILVACSGGPDSMALLDMLSKNNEVVVAHVNYHKRKSANRDENIVRNYCKKHKIKFCKKDYVDNKKGNFQNNARIFRYKFFKELVIKYNLDGVYVAHHKDDLIETYLMQKKKNLTVSYYGLRKQIIIDDVKIIRPLLNKTKDQLVSYCEKNDINYGIDESNLKDDYTRNKIRHSVVEKMTLSKKNKIVKEIKQLNVSQRKEIVETKRFFNGKNRISINDFNEFPYKQRLLRLMLNEHLSNKYLNELIRQIKQSSSFEVLVEDKYLLKEYGYIEAYQKQDNYCYKFDKLTYGKYKQFALTKKGTSFEGVTVSADDFPITIRNYHEGDKIMMRYGVKKISRFFIDNKISSKDRKMWPIMVNSKGNAILVPKIGCNKDHYSSKHNLYMIKLY